MRGRIPALLGSGLFLIVAPGTIAGLIPWLITRWRFAGDLGESAILRGAGAVLLAAGVLGLLECFLRFAWVGIGTPAPVAPTRHLVVSGLYRHVRNPMYLAVAAMLLGLALLLGDARLLIYAATIWLCFHMFVLGVEEPMMRRLFPDDYARFARSVPRWIPRLRPWRDQEVR